jgi:hypothetical protein
MSETVLAPAGPVIESQPVNRVSSLARVGDMAAPMRFAKDTTQGVCAGLLTLAGATQFSGNAISTELTDIFTSGSTEALGAQLVAGNLTGALQIVGAAALFLTAGRGFARVLGLLVFVIAAAAYFNGVSPADVFERSQAVYQALGPAYATFQENLMTM